jgi:hypothetical protein
MINEQAIFGKRIIEQMMKRIIEQIIFENLYY